VAGISTLQFQYTSFIQNDMTEEEFSEVIKLLAIGFRHQNHYIFMPSLMPFSCKQKHLPQLESK